MGLTGIVGTLVARARRRGLLHLEHALFKGRQSLRIKMETGLKFHLFFDGLPLTIFIVLRFGSEAI